jgi:hypothetical protein
MESFRLEDLDAFKSASNYVAIARELRANDAPEEMMRHMHEQTARALKPLLLFTQHPALQPHAPPLAGEIVLNFPATSRVAIVLFITSPPSARAALDEFIAHAHTLVAQSDASAGNTYGYALETAAVFFTCPTTRIADLAVYVRAKLAPPPAALSVNFLEQRELMPDTHTASLNNVNVTCAEGVTLSAVTTWLRHHVLIFGIVHATLFLADGKVMTLNSTLFAREATSTDTIVLRFNISSVVFIQDGDLNSSNLVATLDKRSMFPARLSAVHRRFFNYRRNMFQQGHRASAKITTDVPLAHDEALVVIPIALSKLYQSLTSATADTLLAYVSCSLFHPFVVSPLPSPVATLLADTAPADLAKLLFTRAPPLQDQHFRITSITRGSDVQKIGKHSLSILSIPLPFATFVHPLFPFLLQSHHHHPHSYRQAVAETRTPHRHKCRLRWLSFDLKICTLNELSSIPPFLRQ